jgi:hypothetical protein
MKDFAEEQDLAVSPVVEFEEVPEVVPAYSQG